MGADGLARVLLYHFAENRAKCEALDDWVAERRVEVDGVMVTPALAIDGQHVGAAEVADEAPDGALGEVHLLRDLADGTARVHSDVEENRAVARDEVPVVLDVYAVTCHHFINAQSSELLFRFFDDRNQMLTLAIQG